MRLPVMIYLVWPWEPEHRANTAPVSIGVHTSTWYLGIRPFSSYAQGGDRRGELARRAWFASGGTGPEPTNPWERDHAAKWVLQDQRPEIWPRLRYRPVDFLLRRGRYERCRHRNHRTRLRTCIWSIGLDELCFIHHGCTRTHGKPRRTGAADGANGADTP